MTPTESTDRPAFDLKGNKAATFRQPCDHMKVTRYSRMIWGGSLEEGPEHEEKVICDLCGDGLEVDTVPMGAEESLEVWDEDPDNYV